MQFRLSYSLLVLSFLFIDTSFSQSLEQLKQMSIFELMQVRVTTVSKIEESVEDAPGIVSVMTHDEITRFGGTTLRDVLERIPGLIAMCTDFTNRTTIAIRGDQIKQNSSHVLFLINGRPIRETHEGGVSSDLLETFPVQVIDRIEVIKGPGSVLYGSDAFSGVINIITQVPKRNYYHAAGSSEINGGYGVYSDFGIKHEDLTIIAAVRNLKKTEWNTDFRYPLTESPAGLSDTTYKLNIPDRGYSGFIDMRYKGFKLMSSHHNWLTEYMTAGNVNDVELEKTFVNGGYEKGLTDRWRMELNTTYTLSKLFGRQLGRRYSYTILTELTNYVKISDHSKLVAGGLFNHIKGKGLRLIQKPTTILSQGEWNNYSLYAQYDWDTKNKIKFIGGIQGNKVKNKKIAFVPRVGAIFKLTRGLVLKTLYSEAYRAPSITELYTNFEGGLQGNRYLDPEKIATFDIGLTYYGQKIQGGLSLFRSRQTNIIYVMPPTWQYQNLGVVTFMGVEFEGKYYLNQDIYLMTSLLYQRNKNDETENLSPAPDFGSKAGLSYAGNNGIILSLFYIYQGDPDDKYLFPLNPYQGAYHLVHAAMSFKLNQVFHLKIPPELTLSCQIDNLLNKPHFGFPLAPYTREAIPQIPGRRIYTGLSIEF